MTASLRPAAAEDAEAMAALEAAAVRHPWSAAQYRESLAAGHLALLLEQDERLAGFVVALAVLDQAEILNIAVAVDRQRQGHGARLLQEMLARLAAGGARRVFLEVRQGNLAAQALYRKHGFAACGLRKDYYRSDNGREHAILMEAPL